MDSRNQSFGMLGVRNGSSINSNTNRNTSGTSQVPETNNPGIEGNQKGSAVPNETSKQEVEQLIENNPEVVKAATPVDSPIHKEAEQVTDGDARTTEANNDVVDDFVNNDRYKRIKSEFDDYMKKYNGDQYAGNSLKKRQSMGQFYTPPELTYQMLSQFRTDDMSDEDFENMLKTESLMDPTAGSGNLLAGGISYGFNPENVYANEPDDNVRDNILVPRLTSLGVPRNHIFPSSKHIAKYGKMSDTPEQKEAKYKEWVDNGWISDSKSNKKTFMDTYGAGNALNGNYLEDMQNPETWDEIIENVIESSPEQAQEIASSDLPEPIKEEAEQRLDDNPNNDEVNNAKIKEGIKKLSNEELLDARKDIGEEPDDYSPAVGGYRFYRNSDRYAEGVEKPIADKVEEGIKALSNEEEYKLNNPEPDLYPHGKGVVEGDRKDLLDHAIDQQEKWGGNFEQEGVPTIYNLKGSPEFGEDPNLVKNNFAAAMQNWRSWNDTNESDYLADANEDKRKRWRKHEKWRKGLEKAIAKDKARGLETKPDLEKPVADKVEEAIEEHPEVVKNDPLMPKEAKKEATQVTDGDARTDEANNEAVEKTIEKLSEDFDTVDDLYDYLENVYDSEVPNEPVQSTSGIDWSKVKEYKPGEDGYGRVTDFDENAPDFPVDNDMSKWNRDEDLDEALDEATEEIFDPGLEDLNQYNDIVNEEELHNNDETLVGAQSDIPVTSEEQFEPAPEAPYADNVVQMKEEQDLDQAIDEALEEPPSESGIGIPGVLNEVSGINGGSGMPVGSSSVSSNPVRIPGSSFGSAFLGGTPFTPGSGSSGSISTPSVSKGEITPSKPVETVHSRAGGGVKPEAPKQGTSSNPIGGSKSSGNVISNGATYSGGTNKTSRSLKYVPSSKILPHGEERMESYEVEEIGNSSSSGKEATLNNIESRVKSIQPWTLAEQLGFSSKYKHISYNDTSIDQLSPEQIREVEKILDTLGV